MRANWLCGSFCVQGFSFENYIAEKAFTDRFVQQSLFKYNFSLKIQKKYTTIIFRGKHETYHRHNSQHDHCIVGLLL